ncbi:MAG: quinol:cytochrome C oxidoreductase [Chitinophagaceae bacterium]|nr:quinol:cytochrome C oxidoreductase [Chitinophagaceae bacterium]
MNNHFVIPGGYKKWTTGLMIVGVVTLLAAIIFLHPLAGNKGDNVLGTRFWAVLLQNSMYWLMLVNTAMFFMCITTVAMGGWQVAFRRITEAISSVVPVMAVIMLIVILSIVFGHRYDIYPWLDRNAVAADKVLRGKSGFLNPTFYTGASIVTLGLWWFIGKKIRQFSLESDQHGPMDFETGKRWINKNVAWGAFFIVVYGLSVGSTMPWLWLMSIDAHWFSTMYSWYTFASTFVSGIALITIFVIYFKNKGELEYVTHEHLHDLGKFIFAFSIFWAYLWFSQYMLIWYSNQPEETKYFIDRIGTARHVGAYKGLFFFNLIVNFVCPILLLMKKGPKRNYTFMTFMCVMIIFGHWIDFYQMVMPGTVKNHPHMSWYEFGIPVGFVGLIMWSVARYLSKVPLLQKNHPFLKESIIHHT